MGSSKTFFQPPHSALSQKRDCFVTPPLDAGLELPTSPATSSPRNWKRERIQRATRIFRCLERGRARGKSLAGMLVKHAWRWRGRHFKADPARRIHFRKSTLLRLYYQWVKGGRKPEALALHYRCGNQKITTSQVVELTRLCLPSETRSFSAAYRKLAAPGATASAFRYATPPPLRRAVAKLLAHRRHEQVLLRNVRRFLEGPES
jgi:hypothetical protein